MRGGTGGMGGFCTNEIESCAVGGGCMRDGLKRIRDMNCEARKRRWTYGNSDVFPVEIVVQVRSLNIHA
jgi:hypothetical protein